MFRAKRHTELFSVEISTAALESIFNVCDKFDVDETGGRLLGTYQRIGNGYKVCVTGLLPAGPNAERTATFFLQDGNYQEKLFRAIEEYHPAVEHLGNWHTHHVNGLQTLSGGDLKLYTKIVNHKQHNTDFFYALLVTRKTPGRRQRYEVKHYFFRRGNDDIYEVPHNAVHVTDVPLLNSCLEPTGPKDLDPTAGSQNLERAKDLAFFQEFYPDIKPMLSKATSLPYWKGSMPLVDGSLTSVVAMEEPDGNTFSYSIAASCQHPAAVDVPAKFKDQKFPSARQGIFRLERELNLAIFRGRPD